MFSLCGVLSFSASVLNFGFIGLTNCCLHLRQVGLRPRYVPKARAYLQFSGSSLNIVARQHAVFRLQVTCW